MKVDFKGILEGAWNSIFVKKEIEAIALERITICNNCEHAGIRKIIPFDLHCILCGCNLEMKTHCLSCECPIGKWKAETEEKTEQEIDIKLKADENNNHQHPSK